MYISETNKLNFHSTHNYNSREEATLKAKNTDLQETSSPHKTRRSSQRRLRAENGLVPMLKSAQPKSSPKAIPTEAMDALIKYGKNPDHWSALNCAIQKHDLHAAELLINAGLCLDEAGWGGFPEMRLFAIINRPQNQPQLKMQAYELIKKIIASDVDLQVDGRIQELLHNSIYLSRRDDAGGNNLLQMLLDKCKLNPNLKINEERLLSTAIPGHTFESLRSILNYGIKIDDLDCFSNHWVDPQEFNAENFKKSILLLISHGANPFRGSKTNPKKTAIDQLLGRVITSDKADNLFKSDIIAFLLNLGAKI